MAGFFTDIDGRAPDEGFVRLEPGFPTPTDRQ